MSFIRDFVDFYICGALLYMMYAHNNIRLFLVIVLSLYKYNNNNNKYIIIIYAQLGGKINIYIL